MQAIIYKLSFYNTEVLTKGGSGRGFLFLFTRNRKRNTCETRYSLQTSPPPTLPPAQLIPPFSRLLVKLATPMYYSPTQSTARICFQQCSFKTLTTSSIMLKVQTTNFNNKTPLLCTVHLCVPHDKLKKCYPPKYFLAVGLCNGYVVCLL